ncbi:hypothetical protein [Frigidibacter sp. MR17.24]|uniref:hypothetical protein n=1 Tax=Frigidibacter sp. MR17.24 TaxID=3127345 RepID=UPI003012D241
MQHPITADIWHVASQKGDGSMTGQRQINILGAVLLALPFALLATLAMVPMDSWNAVALMPLVVALTSGLTLGFTALQAIREAAVRDARG